METHSLSAARVERSRGSLASKFPLPLACFLKEEATLFLTQRPQEGQIDFTGLKQLVQMGLGSVAGDITEINLDDPARTVVMELEANNYEDADGKPLSLKYMNNEGIVEEATETPVVNLLLPVLLGLLTLGGVFLTLKALA